MIRRILTHLARPTPPRTLSGAGPWQKGKTCAAFAVRPFTSGAHSKRRYTLAALGTIGASIAAATLFNRNAEPEAEKEWDQGIPALDLRSVGGYQGAVQLAGDLVAYLSDVEGFIRSGKRPPENVLLSGDPGMGKAYLAKAIAGHAGVPFFSARASEFGNGSKAKLSALFAMAERKAPCVLCIQRVEELTPTESAEFLRLLSKERRGVLVVATTTREHQILTRTGRFQFRIPIGPLAEEDRYAILKNLTRDKSLDQDVDLSRLAREAWGLKSVSSLIALLTQAEARAFREKTPLAARHLSEALHVMGLGVRIQDLQTSEEKFIMASHEAGHALVAYLLGFTIQSVTTYPHSTGGITLSGNTYYLYPPGFKGKDELADKVCVHLAGRAAELFVGKARNLCSSDFIQAKQTAEEMIAERFLLTPDPRAGIESLLAEQTQRALNLLKENSALFEKIRDSLLSRRELSGEEFAALTSGMPRVIQN